MTRQEFAKWRTLHTALFPGLLQHMARAFGDNHEAAQVMWEQWFTMLQPYSLEDASEASRRLSLSDEEVRYERHPYHIVQIIKMLKRSRYDWDALPSDEDCPNCGGVGAVVIKVGERNQASTRCTCPLGVKYYPWLRPFNPETDRRA